ncbi:SGNH/GDSL hydrolase family protein [bacterium]|nr:SGNH/GDSL hydrolase family protein [bacterium]
MKSTGVTYYIVCIVAGVLLLFGGCGRKSVKKVEPLRIVFFGDSVTYGYGVNDKTESFFARINSVMKKGVYVNVEPFNAGVNGDDTFEAITRIDSVKALDPDIVIIAFGLNDCQVSRITPGQFRDNLIRICDSFPPETRIVLATSNSFMETGQPLWKELNSTLDIYMDEIRSIARERGYILIDVHAAWKEYLRHDSRNTETMYVDPTHPSAKGHRLIYETYMNGLRKLFVR